VLAWWRRTVDKRLLFGAWRSHHSSSRRTGVSLTCRAWAAACLFAPLILCCTHGRLDMVRLYCISFFCMNIEWRRQSFRDVVAFCGVAGGRRGLVLGHLFSLLVLFAVIWYRMQPHNYPNLPHALPLPRLQADFCSSWATFPYGFGARCLAVPAARCRASGVVSWIWIKLRHIRLRLPGGFHLCSNAWRALAGRCCCCAVARGFLGGGGTRASFILPSVLLQTIYTTTKTRLCCDVAAGDG